MEFSQLILLRLTLTFINLTKTKQNKKSSKHQQQNKQKQGNSNYHNDQCHLPTPCEGGLKYTFQAERRGDSATYTVPSFATRTMGL